MIKKGVISNIVNGNYAEAVIPEENNVVTPALPITTSIPVETVKVGARCVVAFFDTDTVNLADGVIIAIY